MHTRRRAGFEPAKFESELSQRVREPFRRRLSDRDISLDLREDARRLIADRGFDPVFGARPLKRYLQRELETRLGRGIVSGEIADGCAVRIETEDGELSLRLS